MTIRPIRGPGRRRGTIVPILAVCVTALFMFIALAVDLGMMMIARTECQNAADTAALTGARTLDNKVPAGMTPDLYDNNAPAADAAARASVTNNVLMNANFTPAKVTSVEIGVYEYNATAQTFSPGYNTATRVLSPRYGTDAKPAGKTWSCCRVWVNGDQPAYFSRIFGINTMPMAAYAVAVHRPRDIALVLDFTGSMGYSSIFNTEALLGGDGVYNSPDTVYPQFAHYARYNSYQDSNPSASPSDPTITNRPHPFYQTSSQVSSPYVLSPGNFTVTTPNGPAIVSDFWFDPTNAADPTSAATTVTPANLQNAFTATTYDASATARQTAGNGPTPAPANFADQSDSPTAYEGDKYPRKYGVSTGTTWDPTNTNGAAVTLAEYLGWSARYSSGTSLPGISFPTGRTIANFRDATWERYGYDLNVAHYIANRNGGTTWDPRYDAGLSKDDIGRTPNPPTASTYTPSVTAGKFKGYSMGPGYWGKTFFIWPPDPRTPTTTQPGDWRKRFFLRGNGTAFATGSQYGDNFTDSAVDASTSTAGNQTIDEMLLTNGTGLTLTANNGSNYDINYPAVLAWIKSGPQVLPPNLRAGRVRFYTSIPDDVDTGTGTTDEIEDKRFWKAYIDFVLTSDRRNMAGQETMGWPESGGAVAPARQTGVLSAYVASSGGLTYTDPRPYMGYLDNPSRPRMHFWFGPITMMGFIIRSYSQSVPALPGTVHQAQSWQLKAGVNSALDDIRANHPNDTVGLSFFSNADYNSILVPTGQDWTNLKNALFYPQSLLSTMASNPSLEVRPYNSSVSYNKRGDVPNAQGTTDPNTGMALAYNMLSPSPNVNTDPTRRGRRGAAKIVIFETDGVPNSTQLFSFNPAGYDSYYEYSGGSDSLGPQGAALAIVDQIVKQAATTNAGGTDSGHSLPNAPARVYAIGFGDIFSTSAGPTAASFLLQVQQRGGTSAATDSAIPPEQIITGTYDVRIANLRTALERILQSGVQVTLIE